MSQYLRALPALPEYLGSSPRPNKGSRPSVTSVLRDPMPSVSLGTACAWCRQKTHTHKIRRNKSKIKYNLLNNKIFFKKIGLYKWLQLAWNSKGSFTSQILGLQVCDILSSFTKIANKEWSGPWWRNSQNVDSVGVYRFCVGGGEEGKEGGQGRGKLNTSSFSAATWTPTLKHLRKYKSPELDLVWSQRSQRGGRSLKAILGHIKNSKPTWVTWDPVSRRKPQVTKKMVLFA